MAIDKKNDGQPILFPEDENLNTEMLEDEAEDSSGGGSGGNTQFSALPPLPDGEIGRAHV